MSLGNVYKVLTFVCVLFIAEECCAMSKEEKNALRLKTREMFQHAYRHYMDHAYPADELMPLSCRGRVRGIEPSRGDIDDALGNFSLSLVDSLDTLVVLGDLDEFEKAVQLVIRDVKFDTDIVVSVFETNIRVLGGLLGGHLMSVHVKKTQKIMQWYNGELLEMALDLGRRLLPAFNTSTGIPFPRVNLRYGVRHELSRTGEEKDTCTACAGSMLLEFSALSRLTGNKEFEDKAVQAMDYLWQSRHRTSDLVGTVINIHNGDWVRRESGVGAGIDSYYEYLLKAYIMLGDETYLDRFNKHYKAIMKYISNGPLMLDVHMHKPQTNSKHFMDALLAFWPGLQVLKGDLKAAIEMHEMLYQIIQRHNFLPEAFTTDFRVHWAHHPLRPEFVESTYFIYKATGDPYYLEVGKSVIENLDRLARVPCGFAAIKDVTTGIHEDQMDSFVFAETFKYLYLLFSEKDDLLLDVNEYVFSTEAHLMPLFLTSRSGSSFNDTQAVPRNDVIQSLDGEFDSELLVESMEEDFDYMCPSSTYLFKSNIDFAHHVRKPLKNMVEQLCPKSTNGPRPARLRAADFIAGNVEHMQALSRMGIKLVTMNDGRVQLLHISNEAASQEDSSEGMLFMQDMIELSKVQAQDSQEPRVVQLISHPYLGTEVLRAGPAQFGLNLKNQQGVQGQLAIAEPFRACSEIANSQQVANKVVVFERGDCMFVEKARNVQAAGAIGGIVFDNNSESSSDSMPLFSMSGDGRSDVNIPLVFLFGVEARKLMDAFQLHNDLVVYLGEVSRNTNDVLVEFLTSANEVQKNGALASSAGAVDGIDTEAVVSSDSESKVSVTHSAKPASGPDPKKLRLSVSFNSADQLLSSSLREGADAVKVTSMFDNDGEFVKWDTTTTKILEWKFGTNEDTRVVESVADQSAPDDGSLHSEADRLKLVIGKVLKQLRVDELSQFTDVTPTVECFSSAPSSEVQCVEMSHDKTLLRVIHSQQDTSLNTQWSSHENVQAKTAFDTVIWLLRRCTNWNQLQHDGIATSDLLARLTENVFTGGRMGYGVQTENSLAQLTEQLTISEACNLNGARTEADVKNTLSLDVDTVMVVLDGIKHKIPQPSVDSCHGASTPHVSDPSIRPLDNNNEVEMLPCYTTQLNTDGSTVSNCIKDGAATESALKQRVIDILVNEIGGHQPSSAADNCKNNFVEFLNHAYLDSADVS